jgi:serine/threonine protein kinase
VTAAEDPLFGIVDKAKRPEDLFGKLPTLNAEKALHSDYRKKARVIHPDLHGGSSRAVRLFAKLSALHDEAEQRLKAGVYGRKEPTPTVHAGPVVLSRRGRNYVVGDLVAVGDICDVRSAIYEDRSGEEQRVIVKLSRAVEDNDLVENETTAMRQLVTKEDPGNKFYRYLPELVDSFKVTDGRSPRAVNVFCALDDHHTLAEVKVRHKSLVLEDAVWMLNRLLEGLWFAHKRKLVHGGIVPTNVMIHPDSHGARIIDWCYAVSGRGRVKAISSDYKDLYAPEIFHKAAVTPATDIYMAAKCIHHLIGSDAPVAEDRTKGRAAEEFGLLLRSCVVSDPDRRPQDAGALREQLDRTMLKWYGKRKFHKFSMAGGT